MRLHMTNRQRIITGTRDIHTHIHIRSTYFNIVNVSRLVLTTKLSEIGPIEISKWSLGREIDTLQRIITHST